VRLAVALAVLLTVATAEAATPLLPAYAHNDYENHPPLYAALAFGYRGVEADYYVVDGALLVAHDREDVVPGRTLERLYLEPLREIVARQGSVYGDGEVFLLNLESKASGPETYAALHRLLARYADILTVVRDGAVTPGPIQVVLVGWFPPLAELAAQPVRYCAVQSHFRDLPADHARWPAHLLKLITVRYGDEFARWGNGARPDGFAAKLAAIRAARDAVPGRWLRVFAMPHRPRVYAALLDGGVDLLGTKNLARTRDILLEIRD